MKPLIAALCLLLAACDMPPMNAGVTVGTGDDGGGEVSISF